MVYLQESENDLDIIDDDPVSFSQAMNSDNADNLYGETLLNLDHNVGTKCGLVNECSAYLWRKRLRHISKERMERMKSLPI